MITAGCTQNTPTPPADVTTAETTAAPPVPTTAAVPAGTQGPGTCTADISSDASNCGGCGYVCPANAICQEGQCYCREGYTVENGQCVVAPATTDTGTGCPAGMSPCPDGYCYELSSSAENCGICGNACPAGMVCSESVCMNVPTEATTAPVSTTVTGTAVTTTTSTGPVTTFGPFVTRTQEGIFLSPIQACVISGNAWCDGSCVNLSISSTNCGECGKVCTLLTPTCCSGTCTNLQTDESNCGTCGHKCPLYTSCVSGSCKSVVVVTTMTIVKVPITYVKVVDPIYQIPNPGF